MPEIRANHGSWAAIDATDHPGFFIQFLDASRAAVNAVAAADPKTYFAYLEVGPGQRVLDAACGLGDLTRILAEIVAPDGEAVGVDFSDAMVMEARRRAEDSGLPVRFERGDIMALDLPDESFDRARAEQVLQHITSPEAAIAELVRVTRPGGLVAVMEPDWDTLVIDADNLAMSRAFTHYNSSVVIRHGAIGRRLVSLFRDAGLVNVAVTPSVVTPPYPVVREHIESNVRNAEAIETMPESELEAWLRDLDARYKEERFFAAFSYFRVVGRVPDRSRE